MEEYTPARYRVTFDETRHFVNREQRINTIRRDIRQLKRSLALQKSVINVTGVPGIGKSAFFERLYEECLEDADLLTLGYSVGREGTERFRGHFVFTLWRQLAHSSAARHAAPDGDGEQIGDLVGELIAISKKTPLVLLVDGCEYLSPEDLAWLEANLLRRLIADARALTLLSSQAELRWTSFELRRRMATLELEPLDARHSGEQAGLDEARAEELYALTGGYPLANELVREEQNDTALLQRVARELRSRVVTGVTEERWEALQIVSLLREFDLELLQTLLPKVAPAWEEISQSEVSELIRGLVATRLCRPDPLIPAYKVMPPIRRILAATYTARQPELTHEIHRIAMGIYHERLGTVPRSRSRYIVEYCYHWAIYNHLEQPYNVETVRNEFDLLIGKHYSSADRTYVNAEGLRELERLLRADAELRRAFQSLGLPPALLEEIVRGHLPHDGSDTASGAEL